MEVSALLFYPLAIALILFSAAVILTPNPVFSALYLSITMIGLALFYFLLQSFFIAGVQLIVYAGAVAILFIMVLMLFDLNKMESPLVSSPSVIVKIISAGLIGGAIIGSILSVKGTLLSMELYKNIGPTDITTKAIAKVLFTKYVFAFEALGVLLLLVAVGAVVISRIKGGTHAKS